MEELFYLQDFKQWSSRVGPDLTLTVGNKTREKLRKLQLPSSFPSENVVSAYLRPSVDDSRETFSWAVPNLVAVRDFALERFGWDRTKVDRLLKPVLRSLLNIFVLICLNIFVPGRWTLAVRPGRLPWTISSLVRG